MSFVTKLVLFFKPCCVKGIYTAQTFLKGQLKGARGSKGSSREDRSCWTVVLRVLVQATQDACAVPCRGLPPQSPSPRGVGPGACSVLQGLCTFLGSQPGVPFLPSPTPPFQTLFRNLGPSSVINVGSRPSRFRFQACAGTSSQLATFLAGCRRSDIWRQA